nr:MotA/TolQ/ExbB proton channel family protein [Synechocystis sp. FACHB-383]
MAPYPLFLTQTPRLLDEFLKGGIVMFPLLLLSILALTTALERGWFWSRLLIQEDQVVRDVLDAAVEDLAKARSIAEHARNLAIGRFLLAPLKLRRPSPETFRLAMEATADKEFARMRRGDKLLETIIALAPLLGLLGTVTGLIRTFNNLNIGGGGSSAEANQAASGIGEALITTAAGMMVAIFALLVFRVLVSLQSQQMDYFAAVGSELELIYREVWYEPHQPMPNSLTATRIAEP